MNVRALFAFAVFGSFLIGCGSGSPPAANLPGNWLIVGPMPTNVLQIAQVSGFRLAMTFGVTGNNISAFGFANGPCDNPPSPPFASGGLASFGVSATGTVGEDGSFTLQTPAGEPALLTMHGKAPQAGGGGEWSGTYTLSYTLPGTCSGSSSGAVAATSFPLINGVYAGTAQTATAGVLTGMPMTLQVSVKQGGTVMSSTTGLSTPSSILLEGSVQVVGSPCFSSGTIGATPGSAVDGNLMVANFTMDDGSTLSLEGTLTDAAEGTIATGFVRVIGGKCANFYQLPAIVRQEQTP